MPIVSWNHAGNDNEETHLLFIVIINDTILVQDCILVMWSSCLLLE